jgi:hypothetical protein
MTAGDCDDGTAHACASKPTTSSDLAISAGATARVVDEHQQGALRAAILEPPVLAAIDLY